VEVVSVLEMVISKILGNTEAAYLTLLRFAKHTKIKNSKKYHNFKELFFFFCFLEFSQLLVVLVFSYT
jgi:hypothetical protein